MRLSNGSCFAFRASEGQNVGHWILRQQRRRTVMHTTSVSLLERLRQPGDQDAWRRFVKLYSPLIYYWARRQGLDTQDAADLAQEVFALLVQKMPEFTYDAQKSFRAWLRTVTQNKLRDMRKRRPPPLPTGGGSAFGDLPDTSDDNAAFELKEHQQQLVRRALRLMQADFQPTTWKACWELVVSERSAAEVAAELGMTEGAVYAAKFRVLARLRDELKGLMD